MEIVRRRARTPRPPRRLVVLFVGLEHPQRFRARLARADRPGDLDPVPSRAGDLERRQYHVSGRDRPRAGDLELRQCRAALPDEHHVHRRAAAAARHEVLLAEREELLLDASWLECLEEDPEAFGVDARALADRIKLFLALDGSREVEADVPPNELACALERLVVADRHDVVEPVNTDPLPPKPVGQPVSGPVGEYLVLDQGRAVLADVPGLTREDDC